MLVRDWMTHDPVSVGPTTPLIEVYRIFKEYEIRHLPVVERGHIVGIITDHDLGRAILHAAADGAPRTVSDAMSHPVRFVHAGDRIEDAALLMHNHKLGGLPVVDDTGNLVGILTIQDLLEILIAELSRNR